MKKIKALFIIATLTVFFTACSGSSPDKPTIITSETTDNPKKELEDSKNLTWFGDVRNDVTGNWRLSEYASSESQETFAVEYYNNYFDSDDEIHALINMTNKTTARISKMMDDTLNVCIYEYIDGEEHDAKKLFGGMKLKEYFVTISTNEIEDISLSEQ